MLYTKVPEDTFSTIQMNAGVICKTFDPATGVADNLMGATTGGFQFNANPEYTDFGEDIDNVPANTWQLKRISRYDPAASGNFVTLSPALAAALTGGADVSTTTHIVPRESLKQSDFQDVWIVGDYSDHNDTAGSAGFVAIHIKNALNTSGFQWQSTKDGKGQFAFDFHGHYDLTDIEDIPFEIYVKAGVAGA